LSNLVTDNSLGDAIGSSSLGHKLGLTSIFQERVKNGSLINRCSDG
jgi:hypothetical protein